MQKRRQCKYGLTAEEMGQITKLSPLDLIVLV